MADYGRAILSFERPENMAPTGQVAPLFCEELSKVLMIDARYLIVNIYEITTRDASKQREIVDDAEGPL